MTPTRLYVIGNGFDRWHGIPSGLEHFKDYVENTDRDVYREVEDYLPAEKNWANLELALAYLDADMLIDNLGHFMGSYAADDWSDSGHHDFQLEVGNVVERLSCSLQAHFADWVRQLPIPTHSTAPALLSTLDRQARFLSFNYTSTLSRVYGVAPERILFIHGCAAQPDDTLILGHAWNPSARRSLNARADIEELDTRIVEANTIIDDYFSSTFKRSSELIARHAAFFDSLTTIEQVIVLGHSLSDVDAAYFQALLEQPSIARAPRTVALRNPTEWPEKESLLQALGVMPGKATPMLWENL